MVKYRTIQIPDVMVEQILKEMEINEDVYYRSHTEFVIDAVRRRLEELKEKRKS